MSKSPKVSIIIVSYNTRDVLRDCLRSVKNEVGPNDEVIIIDNASPDGSADMVSREFPQFNLVRNTDNVGFSPANNQGMAIAKGDHILLLNPDTIIPPGTLVAWREDHEQHGAALSGPRLVDPDNAVQVSVWQMPSVWNALLELFYVHRLFKAGQYGSLNAARVVGFVSGAAMLFKREWYDRVGGLDPHLFWMEDADLCVRIASNGGRVMYLPDQHIIHIGGQSAKKDPKRAISNQLISRIKFNRKHGNALSSAALVLITYAHVITRAFAFSVLSLLRKEPRAAAYRFTFGKLNRYILHNDLSI